ncbi:IS66 family transposase [Orrella marina]|uniref:IS66 family transposase n=1 Tax=Orrella marina TaxID=2163011 RepID=A0A2R4XMA5_9BURK|nr:IS66 family transposase [Orrella marina]AWB34869.1 IS66 family transposase [Orrella marina]
MLNTSFFISIVSSMDTPFTPTSADSNAQPAAAEIAPFDLEHVTITRREHIELRTQARQYQSLHARAVERMQVMQADHLRIVQGLKAEQAALNTELEQTKTITSPFQVMSPNPVRRKRGQQPGQPGHGRVLETHLPSRIESLRLDDCVCPSCGKDVSEIQGTQDAQVLEIEVKAYRRVIRRHRYRPTCDCRALPGIVMAPPPAQLTPRGKLGNSLLVQALLSKYRHGQPTYRLLSQWRDQGLRVAQGTLTESLLRLVPLFKPLYEAGLDRLRQARQWHVDETRWEVFEPQEDKLGHRWYLWVFKAKDVLHFVMDPSRASSVPTAVLEGVTDGVLSVDRYAAYRKYVRGTPGVKLALCWAHQRRDFLQLANQHPEHACCAVCKSIGLI